MFTFALPPVLSLTDAVRPMALQYVISMELARLGFHWTMPGSNNNLCCILSRLVLLLGIHFRASPPVLSLTDVVRPMALLHVISMEL